MMKLTGLECPYCGSAVTYDDEELGLDEDSGGIIYIAVCVNCEENAELAVIVKPDGSIVFDPDNWGDGRNHEKVEA